MTRDVSPGEPRDDDLAELFRTHGNGLAGAVRGILGGQADTQEILQEAFLKAWRALSRGAAPANRVAWLFVITMNLAKDQRRKEMRRDPSQSLEEVNPMELRSATPPPGTGLEQREALTAARRAILELKTTEQEVFLLRTSAGLSFEQAAAALGIPIGTAKTRMRAALAHLRARLKHFAPAELGQFRPATSSSIEGREAR